MDRISGLPDELLVKVLTFAPTKVAVSTCLLSKRWKFLWLWLPRLDYIREDVFRPGNSQSHELLREFIHKNMPLHRAPVLESLRLELDLVSNLEPEDIKLWVEIAVSRYVCELDISCYVDDICPTSLYTCKSLVSLTLSGETRIDVPSSVCLPSLKTLRLKYVIYLDEESLQQLLSACPVLEDLSVLFSFSDDVDMEKFTVIVPSLQKLELYIPYDWDLDGYEIDTPSLKYLKLEDWTDRIHDSLIEDMLELREAYVSVKYHPLESIIRSITSVKRLTICSEDYEYGDGIVFDKLDHLTMCVCQQHSSTLLGQLLKDSPNLRILDISVVGDHGDNLRNEMLYWNQPSHVPECLLSSLQIVNWSKYFGRPQDRDIAVYILKNARHLKTAIVKADTWEHLVPNLKMIKELALSSRASSTCELVFVEGEDISGISPL